MIKVGRRSKSFFLGIALLSVLLLVIFTSSNGSSSSEVKSTTSEIQKVDMGIGESIEPSNGNGLSDTSNKNNINIDDNDLLSGAKIDQDATAEKEKSYKASGNSNSNNAISGSDASLKSKEESINKAESTKGKTGSFADSKESEDLDSTSNSLDSDLTSNKVGAMKDSPNGSSKGSIKDKSTTGSTGSSKSSLSSTNDYEYVIMIDAGSTGSRVHVYSFDTSVAPPILINEEFKMLQPGLSSFDTDTKGAAASLDPLLQVALEKIPKDKHNCSPVAVKATAGLRLLGAAKSDAILKEVRNHLEKDFPFPVVKGEDGIAIMDGADEGVYAWITTNYLLNNIGTSKRLNTAAVFDLGGGSTQIVFEPTNGENLIEGEHKYEIEFGGRKFILYQYSHLGYGLMQARNKVNAEIVKADLNSKASKLVPLLESEVKSAVAKVALENPCVPAGVTADNVIVEMPNGEKYAVNFIPSSDSSTAASVCKFLTDTILNKDLECESNSCSFNGIYQPSFEEQFSTAADMYVFSYFYDRLQPIGMPESFTLKEMTDIMESVCSGSHLWDQYFTQASHIKELEDEPLWCLDLNFMVSLLHTGYDIPLKRELKTAKTIGGNELGWCLGASLPLLDKTNWSCKVSKQF